MVTTPDEPKPYPFVIHSEWDFDATISELRSILEDPACMRQWWRRVFLHIEELHAGEADFRGFTARCHTKGFLPYSMQFQVRIDSRQANSLHFKMQGDFEGEAFVRAEERNGSTRVFIAWMLAFRHPRLKYFAGVLKPVYVWNHLWAMRQGQKGLQKILQTRRNGNVRPSFGRPTFPHNLAAMQVPARWRV